MKTILIILNLLFPCITLLAQNQVQKGCVKTRGRMVNGKHIPGHGLPGAVVTIKGRNNVAVKNNDGTFSFPVSSTHYFVQSVAKKDYELVDADVASKTYEHTANVQYFVMETPEQLLQDKLEKERTIRRTLNKQLQKRDEEIEMLKAENKISLQKYQQLLQELYAAQERNEKLISEMAERYAKLDYDQLDNFYRQVSNYIEEGDLIKADSLLKTRGDLNSQIDAHLQQGALIQQKKEELNQAESVHQFDKDELARRCYSFFENFKMQHQYDSAAYYIEKRALLDTTNVDWLIEVGDYSQFQKQYHKVEYYYEKAVKLYRQKAIHNSQVDEINLVITLNKLSSLYNEIHLFTQAELLGKEALERCNELRNKGIDNDVYLFDILVNLGNLYCYTNRYDESERMYKVAWEMQKNNKLKSYSNESVLSMLLHNMGLLYLSSQRFSESEQMYKESIKIRKQMAEMNPAVFEPYLAHTQYNLAIVYHQNNNFAEAELMYKEAIERRKRLAEKNAQAFEPDVAHGYLNLAHLYFQTQRISEGDSLYMESLKIYKRLAQQIPNVYEPILAQTLQKLADLYINTQRYLESEAMYKESLEIYRRLAEQNPQLNEPIVADLLQNLALICYNTQRYSESEKINKECLEIRRRFAELQPQDFEPALEQTLLNLFNIYIDTKRYAESEIILNEALGIIRRLAENNPEQYNKFYAIRLNDMSFVSIFMSKYAEAELYIRKALEIDNSEVLMYSNLATALLFQGKYEQAEQIYRQYKEELKDAFMSDFEAFEKANVIPKEYYEDVEKIKQILNE